MTTTTRFRPSLWFDDQAEQAATFYGTVFPNSQITSVSHYGPDMPGPEGAVMYVEFRTRRPGHLGDQRRSAVHVQ